MSAAVHLVANEGSTDIRPDKRAILATFIGYDGPKLWAIGLGAIVAFAQNGFLLYAFANGW